MAGYKGWSMSNNAVSAYNEGMMPLSKWTKKAIINEAADEGFTSDHLKLMEKMTLKQLRDDCLEDSGEWHHTSMLFNKTEFFKLKDEEMIFNAGEVYRKKELKEWNDAFEDDDTTLTLKEVDYGNGLICRYIHSQKKDSWTDLPISEPVIYSSKEDAENFIKNHNKNLKN